MRVVFAGRDDMGGEVTEAKVKSNTGTKDQRHKGSKPSGRSVKHSDDREGDSIKIGVPARGCEKPRLDATVKSSVR